MEGSSCCGFLRSTIGLKILMAVTGVILFGFLVGHVAGNLLFFAGQEALDKYSKFLQESKALLWGARLTLLASVIAHIYASIVLTLRSKEARPVAYRQKEALGSTFASRTMMWSGPVIAIFVVYHILHFTTGQAHPHFQHGAVYQNVVAGFKVAWVALFYMVSMVLLGFHLAHGVWSMMQTLGLNNPNWDRRLRCAAILFSVLVVGGFIAIPLAVLAGKA